MDSHTALLAFVENNIPLDEVICWRVGPANDFGGIGNVEVEHVAIPFLRSVENLMPNTKIRVLDIGAEEFRKFYSTQDWQYKTNDYIFRPTTPLHLEILFPDVFSVDEDISRSCDIWGGDKPRLTKVDGSYFAFYWDTSRMRFVGSQRVAEFFLAPEFPELHIKQCYLAKKYIEEKAPIYRLPPPANDDRENETSWTYYKKMVEGEKLPRGGRSFWRPSV